MAPFLCFIFLLFSSAAASCTECVQSKAAYFASSTAGACGYGPLALKLYGGHAAAALPSLFKRGVGCGSCFQIRCQNPSLCSTRGAKIIVTDLHTDKSKTTDFVLSSRAFRAMALPGKDKLLLNHGIEDIEYRRVPCVYKGQNLALQVEKFSKYPNYLAVKVLYQGGQTDIEAADVAQVDSPTWISMSRNYGVTWDTDKAPTAPLQFRFVIYSGFDTQYFFTEQVLPKNWKPGVTYNSTVQINKVKLEGCTPCKPWK